MCEIFRSFETAFSFFSDLRCYKFYLFWKMEGEKPVFLHELKKRPPDKQLSINELSSLREIAYKYLKEDQNALDLLVEYCKHRIFDVYSLCHSEISSENMRKGVLDLNNKPSYVER